MKNTLKNNYNQTFKHTLNLWYIIENLIGDQ